MNSRFSRHLLVVLMLGLMLASCKDEVVDPPVGAETPTSYDFGTDMSYSGQTVRLLLADTLSKRTKGLKTPGASAVTRSELDAIFENTGNFFADIATGKKLSDKLSQKVRPNLLAEIGFAFDSLVARSAMFAGDAKANTTDAGIYLPEAIEKGIMGGVFYAQALKYLFEEVPIADNTTVTAGEGTKMQHNWDEAFGYFGISRYYDKFTAEERAANQKDVNGDGKIDPKSERNFAFGRYAGARDRGYTNFTSQPTAFSDSIFKGFIAGRAAIARKDYTSRDAAAKSIVATWEKVMGASAIHYANAVKTAVEKNAIGTALGQWAEMKGFIEATQYHTQSILRPADYNTLIGLLGNSPYNVTVAGMDEFIAKLKSAYGF